MEKKLIIIFLLILSTFSLKAQVQKFEWEIISFGPLFGVQKTNNVNNTLRELEYLTEFRINLMDGNISVGLQGLISGWQNEVLYPDRNQSYLDVNNDEYSYAIQFVGDYNFFPTKKVCPFAGLGIGTSLNMENNYGYKHSYSFIATPRVGVELFKWVRFTLEYHAQESPYSNFGARVGIVIGGWNKKNTHPKGDK